MSQHIKEAFLEGEEQNTLSEIVIQFAKKNTRKRKDFFLEKKPGSFFFWTHQKPKM